MSSEFIVGSSGTNGESGSNSPLGQRPSYFDFTSTNGLHPPQHSFDTRVIKKLDDHFDDTVGSENNSGLSATEDEKLKTFLRIRPVSSSCCDSNSVLEIKDEHTVVAYTNPKFSHQHGRCRRQTEFKFSKVLGPESGQSTVFEECVTPIVEKFLRHENCLVFSYGATNAGKTYTMQGHGTEYGIIPRTLDAIFSRISDRQYKVGDIRPHLYQAFHCLSRKDVEALYEKRDTIIRDANINQELMESYRMSTSNFSDRSGSTVDLVGAGHIFDPNTMYPNTTLYSVWVSYAELYNERVYDLLDTSTIGKNRRRKELKLMQDSNGYVYINGLTELPVTSDEEAYKIFLAGRKNLQFAATQMNQHSSRSHSFFTIRVVSIGIGEGLLPYPKSVHRMTFCDLAGMERASQTENEGFRLKESGNINNSLTVLLKVIRVLREKQKQPNHAMIETIPFRESKLTHIFKSYLTSSTHICMVVNVNPDPTVIDSTIQVLQNSAIASNVIVFRPIEVNTQTQSVEIYGRPKPVEFNTKVNTVETCESSKSVPVETQTWGNFNHVEVETQPHEAKTRGRPKLVKGKPPTPLAGRDLKKAPSSIKKRGKYYDEDYETGKLFIENESVSSVEVVDLASDSEAEEYEVATVVAPKTMIQKIKILENENAHLKQLLANSEAEKQKMREDMLKIFAEERIQWSKKLTQQRVTEENLNQRRLSIVRQQSQLSPGSRCGRCSPPRVDMEDIDETFEEYEEEGESDKENLN